MQPRTIANTSQQLRICICLVKVMLTFMDGARHYEERLECSGRTGGHEKGSKGRNGDNKKLLDRTRSLPRKVEELFMGKVQGIVEEQGKQPVKKEVY